MRSAIHEKWGAEPVVCRLFEDWHAPAPETLYRWRVQLECGCVRELYTGGTDRLPADVEWRDRSHGHDLLPAGQLVCWHEGDTTDAPFRTIVRWGDRKDDCPPDPEEPPAYWADLGTEFWAKHRHDRPRAVWSVALSCGHVSSVRVDDLDWKPADGSARREVTADELASQLARLGDAGTQGVDAEVVAWAKRWWNDGCPEPALETMCHTCPSARCIVAYQPVGWLAEPTPKPEPKAPKPPARQTVQRRLREAELRVAELQEQLAQLDDADDVRSDDPG